MSNSLHFLEAGAEADLNERKPTRVVDAVNAKSVKNCLGTRLNMAEIMGVLPGQGRVVARFVFFIISILAAVFALALTLLMMGSPSVFEFPASLAIIAFVAVVIVMILGLMIIGK